MKANQVKKAGFKVWMFMWAFSIFWLPSVTAQSIPNYSPGDYRTTAATTVSQSTSSTNLERFTGDGTWEPATFPIPTTANIYVLHPAQITGSLEVASLIITGNQTLTITAGASLKTTTRLTITPSATLLMAGAIENRGVLQVQANAKLILQSPSYSAASQLWAGTEEIDAKSEIRIENAALNTPLFSGNQLTTQAHGYWFGKLTVAPAIAAAWQLTDGSGVVAANSTVIQLPTGGSLLFSAAPNVNLSFGQDLQINGGTAALQNQTAGTGLVTVAGHLNLQNSTLTLNQTSSATAVTTLDLKGNLSLDAASAIINSSTVNTSTSGIQMTGSAWQQIKADGPLNHVSLSVKAGAKVRMAQNLVLNPTNSVYAGTLAVETGGTLDFGQDATGNGYAVQGQGTFKLDQGGTLHITSAHGLNSTGTTGNVQVTASRRQISQIATYIYSGKLPQQTGNAYTTATTGKIFIIDNPTSVTLNSNIGISSHTALAPDGGRLEIRQGRFITPAGIDVSSSGKLVMTGGVYQIGTVGVPVPLMTGAYEFYGGALELAGTGDQILKGSKIYYHVIFGGTNTAGVNAKTISSTTTVNHNVTILPNAIVDISNKALKGDAGLTMAGGLFRISKTSGTLPELTGKSSPYALTGGTIELYGTVSGQTQSIRGTYGSSQKVVYHNLLLNATQANTANDLGNQLPSAIFDVSGTLTVAAPTVLQIASNRAIGGTGNFVVQPGATLLYGSAQGIKTSGTGTNDGNIRVSGTRTFSSAANYGFVGTSEMVSGDGLPATVANLLVAKSGLGVTLTNSVAVTEVFTLKNGLFKTGSNELSITSLLPDALQLADSSFYIQGNLRRAVGSSGSYTFPVGNSEGKRQLTINSNGLTGNNFQSVRVGFGPLTGHNDADLHIVETGNRYTKIEPQGVWFVEPNAQPSSGSFTAMASLNGFADLSDNKFALLIRPLASQSGADWSTGGGVLDAPNKEGRTVAGGYAKRNFITPFGQLGIANIETTLPVSWLYVKAERKNQHVQLHWATASEINNDRFEVEVSRDGKHFQTIGTVKGSGNSTVAQQYQFRHASPAPGALYYRVKQIDFDAKFEHSKLVAVQAGASENQGMQLALYPNPAVESIKIQGLEEAAEVEIFDLKGRRLEKLVLHQQPEASTISVKHLATGAYILHVRQANQVHRLRFVKQ
ncbi:T9SS type A sorting domain-containing protein [Rufibacter sp. LB8]|uniref:T9SS type A sorting domain-containing protein n=1 Tax=Rufibacter sp. LB8 TaxID=2777781 RepID=UPI00178C3282|nr:T9SS type A sorting domain-containing protein [Rufibacter sp. LB8]